MNILELLYSAISQWPSMFWGAFAIVILALIAGSYFIPRLAWLAVGSVVAAIIYYIGRKNERDIYKKISKDIEEKREEAYEKIDDRNTSTSDVADRLLKGDF